jgi:hypothetical protein
VQHSTQLSESHFGPTKKGEVAVIVNRKKVYAVKMYLIIVENGPSDRTKNVYYKYTEIGLGKFSV